MSSRSRRFAAFSPGVVPPPASKSWIFSLYTSKTEALSRWRLPAPREASTKAKTSSTARSVMPSMVWVLPDPVWPYAKMVALYP